MDPVNGLTGCSVTIIVSPAPTHRHRPRRPPADREEGSARCRRSGSRSVKWPTLRPGAVGEGVRRIGWLQPRHRHPRQTRRLAGERKPNSRRRRRLQKTVLRMAVELVPDESRTLIHAQRIKAARRRSSAPGGDQRGEQRQPAEDEAVRSRRSPGRRREAEGVQRRRTGLAHARPRCRGPRPRSPSASDSRRIIRSTWASSAERRCARADLRPVRWSTAM